jgi:Lrp/AsnC family transcriptional regulator for asnA, asnC and gidA
MELASLKAADIRIIRCLQDDARAPVAKIAARMKMPESTVRHRLNRLVRDGIIDFAAVANPLKLGYQLWVIIEIQAEISKVRSVAQRLARAPEVNFVGVTTGGYDVLAAALFRSNEELLDFTTLRLASIPGIIRTSTSSVLQLVKRTVNFPLPVDLTRNGARPSLRRPKPRHRPAR